MVLRKVSLWFPNYGNNPGVTSKLLRSDIKGLLQNFEVEIVKTYFEGSEEFIIEMKMVSQYQQYITTMLERKFGAFPMEDEIKVGSTYLGRMVNPGKVGFGVFVDIGLRNQNERKDALVPLYQLRKDLDEPKRSTREVAKQFGFIDGFPLDIVITRIEKHQSKRRLYAKLGPQYLERLEFWSKEMVDRLLVTKALRTKVTEVIKEAAVGKFLKGVTYLDPLTTIINCKSKTNGSGLIPKIGSKLFGAPIGLYQSH